jgi:hypothetical protein
MHMVHASQHIFSDTWIRSDSKHSSFALLERRIFHFMYQNHFFTMNVLRDTFLRQGAISLRVHRANEV